MTKSDQIRVLYADGLSTKEIASRVGCSIEYVRVAGRQRLGKKRSVAEERYLLKKHGPVGVDILGIYNNMLHRCYVKKNIGYALYGGRGITVCARWRKSFKAFVRDMGPRPSPKHSLDRINNDGPYSPKNCRWATTAEQARNRRNTKFFTHEGRTQIAADWALELGMKLSALKWRLGRGATISTILAERHFCNTPQ